MQQDTKNPRIWLDDNGDEWLLMGEGKPPQKIWRDPFTYGLPLIAALAAAASVPVQVTIQADSDFEWTHGAYQFSLANAAFTWTARPIPNCSVLITDSGSGRNLMNQAIPVESLFGQPAFPFALPLSKVFGRNSTITFTVTNFDAAVATGDLRLSMVGYKIFYY